MRDFVIKSMDVLVWIAAFLVAAGGIVAGLMAVGQGQMQGLILVVMGPLYAIMIAGWVFLAIGTYHNTKRTAEAIEKLANRG